MPLWFNLTPRPPAAPPVILPEKDFHDKRDDDFGSSFDSVSFTVELVKWGIAMTISYYLTQRLLIVLTEMGAASGKGDIISAKRVLAKRLNRPEIETMDMNAHEARISADVYCPDELDTTFADIGGMEEELSEVRDNVVLPMQMWKLFKVSNNSNISPCPTGVLLYGKPGTGKTLTAKAIAKECGATFISIKAATLMDKWFGEADKLVGALFSLARKLAPTVIFIDEIDTLLRKRESGEMSSSAGTTMQGAFLAEWDGLSSSSHAPVVVLGATNRPMDLDKAYLRRMPVSIKMIAPNEMGRKDILVKMLNLEALNDDLSLDDIANRTTDFTGSDLRELVRVATLQRAKDVVKGAKIAVKAAIAVQTADASKPLSKAAAFAHMRPLKKSDFEYALSKTKKSGSAATDYALEVQLEETEERYNLHQKTRAALAGREKEMMSEFQAAWDSEIGEQVRQTIEKMRNPEPDSGSNNEPLDDPNLD